MDHTLSKDGTRIGFEKCGHGPAVILTLGAFNDHNTGTGLAQALAARFTVLNYDRRGRGDSTDSLPYAIDREIEDIESLIAAAGGSAHLFGYSSGAILALRAVAQIQQGISKLVLFEPAPPGGRAGEIAPDLAAHIAFGRRGEAVEQFQIEAVGIPTAAVIAMRTAPFRAALERMAHTLVYDATIMQALPAELMAEITVPTLVIDGEQSPPVMRNTASGIAKSLANARYHTLRGVGHDIVPEIIAPLIADFLAG